MHLMHLMISADKTEVCLTIKRIPTDVYMQVNWGPPTRLTPHRYKRHTGAVDVEAEENALLLVLAIGVRRIPIVMEFVRWVIMGDYCLHMRPWELNPASYYPRDLRSLMVFQSFIGLFSVFLLPSF